MVCVEGLVAGLGRTTVVFTGDTESVVENLQLRDNRNKKEGRGKGEKRAREKKQKTTVRMIPRRSGGKKNKPKKTNVTNKSMTTYHNSCSHGILFSSCA